MLIFGYIPIPVNVVVHTCRNFNVGRTSSFHYTTQQRGGTKVISKNICLHSYLPKNRTIPTVADGWSFFFLFFYPNNTAIMLCATLFIRVQRTKGFVCQSVLVLAIVLCLNDRSFFLFTIPSVFYALNKMSTVRDSCCIM